MITNFILPWIQPHSVIILELTYFKCVKILSLPLNFLHWTYCSSFLHFLCEFCILQLSFIKCLLVLAILFCSDLIWRSRLMNLWAQVYMKIYLWGVKEFETSYCRIFFYIETPSRMSFWGLNNCWIGNQYRFNYIQYLGFRKIWQGEQNFQYLLNLTSFDW